MNKKEQRKEGIFDFQSYIATAIRRNILVPFEIKSEEDKDEFIHKVVDTAIYNFNQKSDLRIMAGNELLNNQDDDFQTVIFDEQK